MELPRRALIGADVGHRTASSTSSASPCFDRNIAGNPPGDTARPLKEECHNQTDTARFDYPHTWIKKLQIASLFACMFSLGWSP